jgi:hypothetical protein
MYHMKHMFRNKYFALIALVSLLVVGCGKDSSNPAEDSDHAATTTLILQFKQGGTLKYEYVFDDPDGIGGNNPVRFDKISLPKGQTFEVEVVLQNKIGGTTKDMTASIRDAGKYHELFFLPSGFAIQITKTDKDALGFPLGLSSTWVTPAAPASGKLKVTMQHLVIKKAVNQPTDGHSDISVDFDAEIL